MPEGSDSPLSSSAAPGNLEAAPLRVDFGYAFATPHRLTAALPDSGDKTLLDLYPGWLRMAWTYDDLTQKPLNAFMAPRTEWEVHCKPELDGQPFAESRWARAEGWLPVLDNTYGDERASLRLQVAGGRSAAVVRVELANQDDRPHRLGLRVDKPGNLTGVNPGWVPGLCQSPFSVCAIPKSVSVSQPMWEDIGAGESRIHPLWEATATMTKPWVGATRLG